MKKKTNITAGGNMLSYASIMLLAGIGIPILAAMNASLGKHLNSPVAASAFAFFIAFCIALLALLLNDKSFSKEIATAPKHLFFAGTFIAFYVLSITFVAPHFGVGNAIFFVL
ncbi:MAG: EamA-like transporter family protein, partial [Rhodobacterales bacterium]|nr:EamA-like transporter family protein [Rhodobacterales bacterium]